MFLFLLKKQTTSTKCQKTITRNFYVVMLLTKLQIGDTIEQIVRTAARTETQRPQRKLLLQLNASFNESIKKVITRKSE